MPTGENPYEIRNIRISNWRRKVKRECIEYLGGKCVRCGYNRCQDALAFHHRDPSAKDFNLSKYAVGIEKLKAELDKCDLLCANCHLEIHAEWKKAKTEEHEKIVAKHKRASVVEVPCAHCGRLKTMVPSRVKRFKRTFCSQACRIAGWVRWPEEKKGQFMKAKYPDDETLQAMVWKSSAKAVALSLGITGCALKKWCSRRGITTPPRGYWQKREAER